MSNTFSPEFSPKKPREIDRDLTLPSGSSVTVIGAGAFGGWSALYLLRAGYKVTLIDAWGPGNSMASSGGESRLIRCIYGGNPFYTAMAKRALDIWQEEQPKFNRQVFFKTGCLWFANDSCADILQSAKRILEDLGMSYDALSLDDCVEKFPEINVDDLSEVINEHQAGYLLARESCVEVRDLFVREGGTFIRAHAKMIKDGIREISSLELSNGAQVQSDLFLFACGPWLKALFPEVLQAKLTISRQEVYYFGIPAGAESMTRLPSWIDHCPPDHYYGVPGGIRRGFKIAFDRRGPEVDPNTQERVPTTQEIESARAYIANRFPMMDGAPLLEARVCQYSNTADANFIFDCHPLLQNVLMLGGGSGHGFKHGPALGEVVKDVMTGSRQVPYDLIFS